MGFNMFCSSWGFDAIFRRVANNRKFNFGSCENYGEFISRVRGLFIVKLCGVFVYTLGYQKRFELAQFHSYARRWSLTFYHPPTAIVDSRHGEIPKLIIRCHRRSDFIRKQSGSGAFGRLNKQRYYLINSLITYTRLRCALNHRL